jgi:hypothetical protein
VAYLTGLVNGKFEGDTDVINADYTFEERDGFKAGKDYISKFLCFGIGCVCNHAGSSRVEPQRPYFCWNS